MCKRYKILLYLFTSILDGKNIFDCLFYQYWDKRTIHSLTKTEFLEKIWDNKISRIYYILYNLITDVHFDSQLYDLLEKLIQSEKLICQPYFLAIELYKKILSYNPNKENCVHFYRYLIINAWEFESFIIKGLLFEKKYEEIKEFAIQHTFATIDTSFFLESSIWRNVDYEEYLESRNIDWRVETTFEDSFQLFP